MVNLLVFVVLLILCNAPIGYLSVCIVGYILEILEELLHSRGREFICILEFGNFWSRYEFHLNLQYSFFNGSCWSFGISPLLSLNHLVSISFGISYVVQVVDLICYIVLACTCCMFVKCRGSVDPSSVCICIQMQVLMHSKIYTHLGGAHLYLAIS